MKILAIIPARSGSKGVVDKNISLLLGRPLLEYTCLAAKKSKLIEKVIISSDSHEYGKIAINCGVEAPFLRPKSLSGDTIPMLPVLRHVIIELENVNNYRPDCVILLPPTSPLRTEKHIDQAIKLYLSESVDALVSVVEVPHNMTPESLMIKSGIRLELFNKEKAKFRRQEKKKYYARNGPAILILKTKYLLGCENFYEGNVIPYVMNHNESIDIDSKKDFLEAEKIMEFNNN